MQYIKGAALPNFQDTWTDADDVAIDFASGYTFTGKLYDPSNDVVWFTKTSGITGAASAPNIAVAWDATELNIDAGDYVFYVTATRTSDSKKYKTAYGLTIAADGEASIYTPPPGLYGVPEGGTAEQVLAKASADDGDTYWKTIVSDAVQSVVSGTGITVDNTDPQNPIISATAPPTQMFSLQNQETTVAFAYVGYKATEGDWYIYRRTRSTNLREYATGLSNYATNWTNRASLSYN